MARRKKQRKKSGGIFSAFIRIISVAVFAILLGYGVGQVAIRVVTKPLVAKEDLPEVARNVQPLATEKDAPASSSKTPKNAAKQTDQPTTSKNLAKPTNEPVAPTKSSVKSADRSVAPAQATPKPQASQPIPRTTPSEPQVKKPEPAGTPRLIDKPERIKADPAEPDVVPAMAKPSPSQVTPSVITQSSQSGGLWRVRLGRYATKTEADAVLTKIKDHVPQAYVIRDGVYQIQAGAFGDQARALALQAELAALDLTALVVAPSQ